MKTLVLTAQQTHSNVAALSWYNVEVTFISLSYNPAAIAEVISLNKN